MVRRQRLGFCRTEYAASNRQPACEDANANGTNAPGRGRGFGGGGSLGVLMGAVPHATRDELLQRMHDHIMTVVGRYKSQDQGLGRRERGHR